MRAADPGRRLRDGCPSITTHTASLRTTVTLAADVAAAVDELRRRRGSGISEVVNDLLRQGLAHGRPSAPFQQRVSDTGEARLDLDDVSGLLDALDGDDRRS